MYNNIDIKFVKESCMNKNNQKKNAGALIGAAFLMATSAIGPGFLTQTGKFTYSAMNMTQTVEYAQYATGGRLGVR